LSARSHLCGGVALTLILGVAGAAAGHAFLDRAEPRVGARVRTPPAQVTLWFTERLEPAYSRVQVLNEAGRRVDKDDGAVVGDGRQLRVSLEAVPTGAYQVRWRVLSVDTHITEGDFAFRVGP
jgi:methionine-rich copper-binding protein CopC